MGGVSAHKFDTWNLSDKMIKIKTKSTKKSEFLVLEKKNANQKIHPYVNNNHLGVKKQKLKFVEVYMEKDGLWKKIAGYGLQKSESHKKDSWILRVQEDRTVKLSRNVKNKGTFQKKTAAQTFTY